MVYDVNRLPEKLVAGYLGESGVAEISVDCSEWFDRWPDGEIKISYQYPDEKSAFEIDSVNYEVNSGVVTLVVTREITYRDGEGTLCIELLYEDEVRKRSALIRTVVLPSHSMDLLPAPEYESWMHRAEWALAEMSGKWGSASASIEEQDEDEDLTVTVDQDAGGTHFTFGMPHALRGFDGASIVDAEFSGDDIVFTRDDSQTVVLEDAKNQQRGAPGKILFPVFHIDIETMEQMVDYPDEYESPTFYLNARGELVATYA